MSKQSPPDPRATKKQLEDLVARISKKISQNPSQAANLLTDWIKRAPLNQDKAAQSPNSSQTKTQIRKKSA